MKNILKNIKLKLLRRKSKLINTFNYSGKNLCTPDYFRQRLAIEKRRAERLNYKSSIIIFNLKDHLKKNNLKIEYLIKIICSSLRETDEVCLFKDSKILILLPDTNNMGAQYTCVKIIDNMKENYWPTKKLIHEDFEIEILTYPEKQTEEKLQKDIINIQNKSEYKKDRSNLNIFNNFHLEKSYIENLDLCLYTFNGSSMAIPVVNAIFWDQPSISNYLLRTKKSIKRALDIIGSIMGLILLSPFILLIASLIKITSPGPILYKQNRVGYGGKCFTFLKFRSMRNNCEDITHNEYMKKLINGKNKEINNGSQDSPLYKIINDPRITPLGKFLRKTGIDELPQLLNVLKGDMSLVGPRPPIDYEVNEYKKWHYRRLLEVKPGITGLWQVSGRNRITFNDMVRLDIYYAKNWSLFMDSKILLKTIRAIISAEGT